VQNKSTVQIVIVPNRYLETPAYDIRRIRDDESGLTENASQSHLIATQPIVPVDTIGNRDEKPQAPAPLVTAITPTAPVPLSTEQESAAPPVAPVEVPQIGILVRLWRFFFGGVGQTPDKPAAPEPQRPDRSRQRSSQGNRDHDRHRDSRGSRDGHRDGMRRDRGDRDRNRPRDQASKEPRRDGQRDLAERKQRPEREKEVRPAQAPGLQPAQVHAHAPAPTALDATVQGDAPRPEREGRDQERGGRSRRGRRRRGGRGRSDEARGNADGAAPSEGNFSADGGDRAEQSAAAAQSTSPIPAPSQHSFEMPQQESHREERHEAHSADSSSPAASEARPQEPKAPDSRANQSFHFEPTRSSSEPGKTYTVWSSGADGPGGNRED